MDITVSNYHMDITERGLKPFLYNDRIGICNLENGKKTIPSYDRVITSDKYVFIEVNNRWGMLDLDLRLIVPPIYTEIFPVKQIDRDSFISTCFSNNSAVCVTLNSNDSNPTHIAIQKKEIDNQNRYGIDDGGLRLSSHNEYKEEEKACIFEVIKNLEDAETDLFVTISDEDIQLIDIDEIEIKQNTGFRGYVFLPLWHYKDNMFIIRNMNGTYVTSVYLNGRFSRKSLWGIYNDSFDEYGSPRVVLHRNGFISVCYPENFLFVGSPVANEEKEKAFEEKRGKWALLKYFHVDVSPKEDLCDMIIIAEECKSCFELLTGFVYDEPMTQTNDDDVFICHGGGHDFLMKYEVRQISNESKLTNSTEEMLKEFNVIKDAIERRSNILSKVGKKYDTIPASDGQLKIVNCFNSIDTREDGMFDISTDEGYGLCDENMKVLIPTKYDYPIEWGEQIMIVVKKGKYGVINTNAEEIVPCQYEYIQVGKGEMQIWDWDCEWDNTLIDTVNKCTINNKVEITPSDDDLVNEGYIIVGINLEWAAAPSKISDPQTLSDKLHNFMVQTQKARIKTTHCDIYSPSGKILAKCKVDKLGKIFFSKREGTLTVKDSKKDMVIKS